MFSCRSDRALRASALLVLLGTVSCKSGGGKTPVPGTLLDQQIVKVGPETTTKVVLGMGDQAATIVFPPGATHGTEDVEVSLTSGVDKHGGTPANGTSVDIATTGADTMFSPPAVLQQSLPPPASGSFYRAAHAGPMDTAWTLGAPARFVGPAPPIGDAGSGLQVYEVDILSTGIWTIVLDGIPDGGTGADGSDGGPSTDVPVVGVGSFREIATGFDGHTCGLRGDGTIACWGVDTGGGARAPAGSFAHLGAGSAASCALQGDGAAECWGLAEVSAPPNVSFTALAAGNFPDGMDGSGVEICGVVADGSISCWGQTGVAVPAGAFTSVAVGYGQICGIKKSDASIVCSGTGASPPAGSFTQLSIGRTYGCAVKSDGSVACWGVDTHGETEAPSGTGFTEVSAGTKHTCGVRGAEVVCWGDDAHGQSDAPKGTFTHVSAGDDHTCGLLSDGGLVCWGTGVTPRPLVRISTTYDHTCGIGTDGRVTCWGDDSYGQSSPPAGAFKEISVAYRESCGIRMDGTIACWGASELSGSPLVAPAGTYSEVRPDNVGAQYAVGLKTDGTIVYFGVLDILTKMPEPNLVAPAGSFTDLSISALGGGCAVAKDGTMSCWGEWGDDSDLAPVAPLTAPAGTFSQVALEDGTLYLAGEIGALGGARFGCGVQTDGTPLCWAEPGIDLDVVKNVPLVTVKRIAVTSGAGFDLGTGLTLPRACAILTGGELACWGDVLEDSGPGHPPPDGTYTDLSSGGANTCVIDSKNQPWCWGEFVLFPLDSSNGTGTGTDGGVDGGAKSCARSCTISTTATLTNMSGPGDAFDLAGHWVYGAGSTEKTTCADGTTSTRDLTGGALDVTTTDQVNFVFGAPDFVASSQCFWSLSAPCDPDAGVENCGDAGAPAAAEEAMGGQGQSCSTISSDATTGVTRTTYTAQAFDIATTDGKTATLTSSVDVTTVADPAKTGCAP